MQHSKSNTIPVSVAPNTIRGEALERTIAAEHPGPAKRPTDTEQRILLPRKAVTPLKGPREAIDISYRVNVALTAARISGHISIY